MSNVDELSVPQLRKILECIKWNMLLTQGYVIVPSMDKVILESVRSDMHRYLQSVPEFKDPKTMFESGIPYVGGGFAALGNPSSFHNYAIRRVHNIVYKKLFPVFSIYLNNNPHIYLEMIPTRMLFRRPGQAPSKESWHRDQSYSGDMNNVNKISLNALEDDIIFGGWTNLDNTPQVFSGIPGSHKTLEGKIVKGSKGFFCLPREHHAECKRRSKRIRIPPGHTFIFNQQMIHEVFSKKTKKDILRVFCGFRLTRSSVSLIPNLEKLMRDQAVIPLKSGQIPPMYPTLWWINWRDKLVEFSNMVRDECKEERTLKTTGQKFLVVQRFMKSLKEMGLELYEEYSPEELRKFFPHKK
jgi:hypothetical protein